MEKLLKKPVEEIMTKKVIAVKSNESIKQLFKLMDEEEILGVPVVDKSNKVIGIVTESDLIKHFTTLKKPKGVHLLGSIIYLDPAEYNQKLKEHCAETVEDLMTKPVITIKEGETLLDAINLMSESTITRLPVVDKKGKLIGVVTRSDIVHQLAKLKH